MEHTEAAANAPACLYADDDLLVLVKPSGLLCVPGRGPDKQDCLSARAQARWPEALIVHRLDQATSGLVLMARHLDMQRALSALFAQRQVYKRYEAIVAGIPESPTGTWQTIDDPIAADWERRPLQVISPAGKPSLTRWSLLGPYPHPELQASRLRLEPITGRTHQLRLHLQHAGWPMLGDALYAPAQVAAAAPRLLLHACELQLTQPLSGRALHLESAAPF